MNIEDLKDCFANVSDDTLLRENGLLYAENKEKDKEIERLNNIIDEQTLEYIGLYSVLDELLKRIEKCTDINELARYCDMYERIYKLKELKGSDDQC